MDLLILGFCVAVLVMLYGIYKRVRPSPEEKKEKIWQEAERKAMDKLDPSGGDEKYNKFLNHYYNRLLSGWIEEHGEENLTEKVKAELLEEAKAKASKKVGL